MSKLISILDDDPEVEFYFCLVCEKALKNNNLSLNFFQDSRHYFDRFVEDDCRFTQFKNLFGPDLILPLA